MQNGLTGLMVACQKGLADIVKTLLEARADTDMTEEVHHIDYIRLCSLYVLWVHVAMVSYTILYNIVLLNRLCRHRVQAGRPSFLPPNRAMLK